jgi:hypothetical protein
VSIINIKKQGNIKKEGKMKPKPKRSQPWTADHLSISLLGVGHINWLANFVNQAHIV